MKNLFWVLLFIARISKTCFADDVAFAGSGPITGETVETMCTPFPNCFTTLQQSLGELNKVSNVKTVIQATLDAKNLSAEQFSVYWLCKSYLGLLKAEATLSDSDLKQENLPMKFGITSRDTVRELLEQTRVFMKRTHLDKQTLQRIADQHLF